MVKTFISPNLFRKRRKCCWQVMCASPVKWLNRRLLRFLKLRTLNVWRIREVIIEVYTFFNDVFDSGTTGWWTNRRRHAWDVTGIVFVNLRFDATHVNVPSLNRIIPLWNSLPEEKTKYHAPILEVITTLCLNDYSRWMICMTSGLDIEDYLRPHWTILLLLILLLLNSDNILVTIDICIKSCLQLGHCVYNTVQCRPLNAMEMHAWHFHRRLFLFSS